MGLYVNDRKTGDIVKIADSCLIDEMLQEDSNNPVSNKTITKKFSELSKEVQEIKKSVSDGKELVAAAITEKGVATSKEDDFSTIANNIKNIPSGGDGKLLASQKIDFKGIASNNLGTYIIKEDEIGE